MTYSDWNTLNGSYIIKDIKVISAAHITHPQFGRSRPFKNFASQVAHNSPPWTCGLRLSRQTCGPSSSHQGRGHWWWWCPPSEGGWRWSSTTAGTPQRRCWKRSSPGSCRWCRGSTSAAAAGTPAATAGTEGTATGTEATGSPTCRKTTCGITCICCLVVGAGGIITWALRSLQGSHKLRKLWKTHQIVVRGLLPMDKRIFEQASSELMPFYHLLPDRSQVS